MEWYCTECGRPSDTNGGTCECGSTSFERAVVQVTKECTTCGTRVPEHTTTCPDCGFTGFEPLGEPQPRDEGSYIEWRCEEGGDAHTPPHPPHAPRDASRGGARNDGGAPSPWRPLSSTQSAILVARVPSPTRSPMPPPGR